MALFSSRRVNIGIGKETSRGVGVAAGYTIPLTNVSFDDKANKARSGEAHGNIGANGAQALVTGRFSEGSLEGEVNANSFGLLMLSTFGTDTPSTVSGSAIKHTFTLSNTNQHQSLSVHAEDPIGDMIFKGCMVDSLEISVEMNELVRFVCGLKGKKGNDDLYTPAQAVDYKFTSRDLIFKIAADTASLGAATALSLKSLKFTISKNTEYNWVLGTLEPEDINNRTFTIEGELELNYEDRTWRDYMCNGGYKAIGIKLTNTRDTISSINPEFYLELPRVDFAEWESSRDLDEIASQKINFTALWDVANGQLVSNAYVINSVASY